MIYTSGSTGTPKGVMVPRRAVVNFCTAFRDMFSVTSDGRILQFSNPAFDVSVSDFFATFTAGATVIGAPRSTLLAGVWVDKSRRLRLLVGANFGRALLFGLIPLAVALGVLNVGLLAALVFLAATLTVVFDLAYQAYQAYLPSLVGGGHLIESDGKLEGSRSFAQMSGPGMAGPLIGLVTAPVAILVDAVTYLVSAVTLLFIRRPEPAPR